MLQLGVPGVWATENNDWTRTTQTLFIRHEHNKPFVTLPVMIYSIQHIIPQIPTGIHYSGRYRAESLLSQANNRKPTKKQNKEQQNHVFAILSVGEYSAALQKCMVCFVLFFADRVY